MIDVGKKPKKRHGCKKGTKGDTAPTKYEEEEERNRRLPRPGGSEKGIKAADRDRKDQMTATSYLRGLSLFRLQKRESDKKSDFEEKRRK